MKGKLIGFIVSAIMILAVVAIATRIPTVRNLVFGAQKAA